MLQQGVGPASATRLARLSSLCLGWPLWLGPFRVWNLMSTITSWRLARTTVVGIVSVWLAGGWVLQRKEIAIFKSASWLVSGGCNILARR